MLVLLLFVLVLADTMMLFRGGHVDLVRVLPDRLSNGDENLIKFEIDNRYHFPVSVQVLDEIPDQFQIRDFMLTISLTPGETTTTEYHLVPKARGEYIFGKTNILVTGPIGLIIRRSTRGQKTTVKVYPTFLNLHKYELAAISNRPEMGGQKKIKRISQSTEFDHIKEYVSGDDPRHINWSATARKSALMINHYIDEKSQPVYAVIDKSRSMKMPFEQMTLLDYAINSALVISNLAINKGDRAGLVTFQHEPETYIPARKRNRQINYLLESLYAQDTEFNEPDFSSLYSYLAHQLTERSLLLLYTNFESIYSLERQLKYIKLINKKHLIILIFFRNTEVDRVIKEAATSTEGIYTKAIARNMLDEKIAIQSKLQQNGVLSLYTTPQQLSVDVINKYIEVKTRRLI